MMDLTRWCTTRGLAARLLEFYKPDGSNFTIGVFARDASGEPVSPEEDNATCFCMWGALYRMCRREGFHAVHETDRGVALPELIEVAAVRLGRQLIELGGFSPDGSLSLACANDLFGNYAKLRPNLERIAAEAEQ